MSSSTKFEVHPTSDLSTNTHELLNQTEANSSNSVERDQN